MLVELRCIANHRAVVTSINAPAGTGGTRSPPPARPRYARLRNVDTDVDQQVSSWVLGTGYRPVSPRCSLFARKFPPVNVPGTAAPAANGHSLGIKGRLFSKVGHAGVHVDNFSQLRHDPLLEWALSCSTGLAMGSHCNNYTQSAPA